MEVASLNEGEWLCYRGSQFNGGGVVVTEVDSLKEGEWPEVVSLIEGNGHVTEVASLVRENGHVTELVTLMEGEWSRYRSGHFNGGKMVMLQRW